MRTSEYVIRTNEGLLLETSALKLFTVASMYLLTEREGQTGIYLARGYVASGSTTLSQ